jgi:hypothetical protein
MAALQGFQHVVAEHDVTAIGEDVELHGGEVRKVSRSDLSI